MQAHTKKHHIDEIVTIRFKVHRRNVEEITKFVDSMEKISVDEFYNKHFADLPKWAVALRGYRYRENLTQTELAELSGIPQRHLSETENGKRPMGKERARRLAKVLNTDYRVFL